MNKFLKYIFLFVSSHRKYIIIVLFIAGLVILCTFLASSGKHNYSFKDSSEAISAYRNFLEDMKNEEKTDTRKIKDRIIEWKTLSDTVFSCLKKDSVFINNALTGITYYAINDSIKKEFSRLSETCRFSYSDVMEIKEITSPFHDDKDISKAVAEATPFFVSLDSIQTPNVSKKTALDNYRKVLTIVGNNGVKSKEELLSFIKLEDIAYRTFLPHLYELDDDKVSDITRKTERICHNIFVQAQKGNIPSRDVMIYMSMRTVRRLVQNSVVCVNDINKYKMKNREQANAYLWMIIQPYTSIDEFAVECLTPENKESLKYIASKISSSSSFAREFNIDPNSLKYLLPQQLLKMYILSL